MLGCCVYVCIDYINNICALSSRALPALCIHIQNYTRTGDLSDWTDKIGSLPSWTLFRLSVLLSSLGFFFPPFHHELVVEGIILFLYTGRRMACKRHLACCTVYLQSGVMLEKWNPYHGNPIDGEKIFFIEVFIDLPATPIISRISTHSRDLPLSNNSISCAFIACW